MPWHSNAPSDSERRELDTLTAEPILDIGCGTASDLEYLRSLGRTAVGLDISSSALRFALVQDTSHVLRGALVVGDTSRLPFRDNSFSTAFDFGCLNCHSLQAIPAYVRELARVMRPGGQFLLRSRHPDQDGPEPKPADAPHRYTLEQLRGFLEPTIALEEVGEAYEPVLAPHRRRRYVTWWRVQSAP